MALVNRDKDQSEQRETYNTALVTTVTGQTYNVCIVPYPSTLVAASVCGNGVSGAPNYSLWLQRMVVGVGITSINIGNSLVLTTFGTSGPQGFSLPNALTFPLQANDALVLSAAAANTATVTTTVTLVIKALQDIKSHFGV